MNSRPHNAEDLLDRVAALENQNRRFKQLGAAVLILFASLIVMGQAPSKKTVEANEFILKDDGGNIRARLFVTAKHTESVTLAGTTNPTRVTFNPEPTLALYNEKGQPKVMLDDSDISFFNSDGKLGGQLGSTTMMLAGDGSGALVSPYSISVFDEQGFSSALGVQSLETPRTGQTQKTSAASLVLFDNKKNVIWKAP